MSSTGIAVASLATGSAGLVGGELVLTLLGFLVAQASGPAVAAFTSWADFGPETVVEYQDRILRRSPETNETGYDVIHRSNLYPAPEQGLFESIQRHLRTVITSTARAETWIGASVPCHAHEVAWQAGDSLVDLSRVRRSLAAHVATLERRIRSLIHVLEQAADDCSTIAAHAQTLNLASGGGVKVDSSRVIPAARTIQERCDYLLAQLATRREFVVEASLLAE